MSIQNAIDFFSRVNSEEAFAEQVLPHIQVVAPGVTGETEAIVAAAAKVGFSFTVEDVKPALDVIAEHMASSQNGELSDAQLEHVSGGWGLPSLGGVSSWFGNFFTRGNLTAVAPLREAAAFRR